jgi:hypothetical protein
LSHLNGGFFIVLTFYCKLTIVSNVLFLKQKSLL